MRRLVFVLALGMVLVLTTVAPALAGGARPDDRAVHGVAVDYASMTAATRPDDRAWRGVGVVPATVEETAPLPGTSGFDWADAGIGAAAVALLVLLAGGLAVLVRRPRVPAV